MSEKVNQYQRNSNINPLSINTTKLGGNNLNGQASLDKQESDKVFLERTGVKTILNTLLDSLYKNQPEDPIHYICNYFDSLNQADDLLASALERLSVISYSSPVFDDCVLELYTTMTKSKLSNRKQTKINVGEIYNSIIEALISDIVFEIRITLLKLLKKQDHDAISFDVFRSSIKIISLFKEYLNQCRILYKELEAYSNDEKVDQIICEVLIEQLQSSFQSSNTNRFNNESTISLLYEISPTGIVAAINEKYIRNGNKSTNYMSYNDFVINAGQFFLNEITNEMLQSNSNTDRSNVSIQDN